MTRHYNSELLPDQNNPQMWSMESSNTNNTCDCGNIVSAYGITTL